MLPLNIETTPRARCSSASWSQSCRSLAIACALAEVVAAVGCTLTDQLNSTQLRHESIMLRVSLRYKGQYSALLPRMCWRLLVVLERGAAVASCSVDSLAAGDEWERHIRIHVPASMRKSASTSASISLLYEAPRSAASTLERWRTGTFQEPHQQSHGSIHHRHEGGWVVLPLLTTQLDVVSTMARAATSANRPTTVLQTGVSAPGTEMGSASTTSFTSEHSRFHQFLQRSGTRESCTLATLASLTKASMVLSLGNGSSAPEIELARSLGFASTTSLPSSTLLCILGGRVPMSMQLRSSNSSSSPQATMALTVSVQDYGNARCTAWLASVRAAVLRRLLKRDGSKGRDVAAHTYAIGRSNPTALEHSACESIDALSLRLLSVQQQLARVRDERRQLDDRLYGSASVLAELTAEMVQQLTDLYTSLRTLYGSGGVRLLL